MRGAQKIIEIQGSNISSTNKISEATLDAAVISYDACAVDKDTVGKVAIDGDGAIILDSRGPIIKAGEETEIDSAMLKL